MTSHPLSLLPDVAVGIAAFLLVSAVAGSLARHGSGEIETPTTGLSAATRERLDKSAAVSLFGQFRSSVADFLYLKVDKYLHNGVDLRGLTSSEKSQNFSDVRTSAKDIKAGMKQHTGETTVVPSADRDWRGVIGNIEREVQPYQDMRDHTHKDPKEALPLFRLMTQANPQYINGYVIGAAMIARDKAHIGDAIRFLQEGAANNPESIEIKAELGSFFVTPKYNRQDFKIAEAYLVPALVNATKRDPSTLSDDEKDAWEDCYRWLVLAYRYDNKPREANAVAAEGLKHFPRDVTCTKQMRIAQGLEKWVGSKASEEPGRVALPE